MVDGVVKVTTKKRYFVTAIALSYRSYIITHFVYKRSCTAIFHKNNFAANKTTSLTLQP